MIYVASRVKHAPMWKELRDLGCKIGSIWIDEAGEGETGDFSELWDRIRNEIKGSDALVLYVEKEDFPLKGALVECGIAMAFRVPIYIYTNAVIEGRTMRPIGSWSLHENVRFCDSLKEAIDLASELV
jgi:hypothetical protein